ncbi:MFS transporter [Pallidibacillus thermolactis]|jgi:MFS transporter, DHA1 family, multidrug resistance protein|uniref:MFS transporter n=1 Tax=Pallidibacillus thermolactis TaxID=251051 RepID=UPI002E21DC90|nr:MFS transporter [Pallidibacillus thermolactis]MED1672437.1 MFS transporter [Pallidibacillus thermolactis subsp. kokeshiiformis]
MWIANFLVSSSLTMIMPFLSLYIDSMGEYSTEYVTQWAGLIFGITFLTAFIFSPIWGRIGDRYGFKPVLLLTGFGISASLFLMGLMNSVYELFFLRFFMGIVTGFIPLSLAMISKQTPKNQVGEVLGILQTGGVTGTLFGPLIGGFLADLVGFKFTFIYTSFSIFIAALFVIFGVKEKKVAKEQKEKQHQYSSKEVFGLIIHNKVLLSVMIISLLTQVAVMSIQPLLAVYVNLLADTNNAALFAGITFSATGFGNLIATRKWGRLGDRIGYEKVMLMLLIGGAIVFIPQALVTSLWQLILLRFLFGMAIGGIIPCMTAFIRQVAPVEIQGEVNGYNVSFRFLGNVLGPTLGGFISGFIGISSVFYVTSAILFIAFLLLTWSVKHEHNKKEHKGFSTSH